MAISGTTQSFKDFDEQSVLAEGLLSLGSPGSRNFVLDFNKDRAWFASDLGLEELTKAFELRDDRIKQNRETRWINIEQPEHQHELINYLADRYGFSNRLRESMLSNPNTPKLEPQEPSPLQSRAQEIRHPRTALRQHREARKKLPGAAEFVKQAAAKVDQESLLDEARRAFVSELPDLNFYRIVNDVWHFNSVDWGYKYMSISYNLLFRLRAPKPKDYLSRDKPDALRLWTWLVLCADGTVISIRENPRANGQTDARDRLLARANLLNVFRQLSKAKGREPLSKVMTIQIRSGLQQNSSGEEPVTDDESPSLLLFYLFEDWYASYNLIAQSKNEFGQQLDRVVSFSRSAKVHCQMML